MWFSVGGNLFTVISSSAMVNLNFPFVILVKIFFIKLKNYGSFAFVFSTWYILSGILGN